MRTILISIIVLLNLLTGCATAKTDSLKIAVISDIHYLSPKLAGEGGAIAAYEASTGRNINDLHEVLDKVLSDLVSKDVDFLLITGDLTNHGERQSHLDLIEKLKDFKAEGVSVFVVPGNHDVNILNSKSYIGEIAVDTESITKEEFAALYSEFGYGDALRRDDASLSYLAEIDKDTWLLAIDTNRYDEHSDGYITFGRIRNKTMEWALNILSEANEKGIRVMGMMHHGLVEHMPYQSSFFPQYLIENWGERADQLADAGLEIVFTGHFHSNDITLRTSASGNTIYDVETASLAQYPFAYRVMKLTDSDLSIDSYFVTSIPGNRNLEKEYRQKLEENARRVAQNELNKLGLPVPEEIKNALMDLIIRTYLAHVKGDEKPDIEMMIAIKTFASALGNEIDANDYSFDFPPADNKLVIEFSLPVEAE